EAEYAGSVLVHSHLMSLLMGLLLGGLAVLFLAWFGGAFPPLLAVLAVTPPFFLVRGFARRYAFSHLRFGPALLVGWVTAAVQIGLLICLVLMGDLSAVLAHGTVGVSCGVAGVAWLFLARREFAIRWQRVAPEFRRSWAFGAWILASNGAAFIHGYLMD